MPMSDTYRQSLARLQQKEATLRKELARHEDIDTRSSAEARKKLDAASKASSPSLARSHYGAAERAQKKSTDAKKKMAEITKNLGANAKQQADKKKSLDNAIRNEQKTEDRAVARRQIDEKKHAQEIARLSVPEIRYVHIREPKQEKLRVLYLTARPCQDVPDEYILRVDQEVRQVQQALRGAKYRDLIEIHHRPAATFQDLLDGLNDVNPHIVHFSGHGGEETLLFDIEEMGSPNGKTISFRLLVKALGSTDTPPTLLVMNACATLAGSGVILPAIPVIIAMSEPIGDLAAVLFARQLYAAIASGQSVGSAMRQAKVKMEEGLADPEESELPQFVARDDVDVSSLVLVAPNLP